MRSFCLDFCDLVVTDNGRTLYLGPLAFSAAGLAVLPEAAEEVEMIQDETVFREKWVSMLPILF